MWEQAGDIAKAGFAGIMGLLWWDIRQIRKERVGQEKKTDEKLKDYITAEKHDDLCKINTLEQNSALREFIDDKFKEMRTLIIENGRQ